MKPLAQLILCTLLSGVVVGCQKNAEQKDTGWGIEPITPKTYHSPKDLFDLCIIRQQLMEHNKNHFVSNKHGDQKHQLVFTRKSSQDKYKLVIHKN